MENEISLYGARPERRKKIKRCNLGSISIVALLSLAPGFSRVNPAITRNKTRFNGLSLRAEAVETASQWFANVITGLKPGANENIPPFVHNLRCAPRSFGHCCKPLLLRRGSAGFARLAPFVQFGFNRFHCRLIQFVEEHENEQRNHAD
jgi:hypothetical protein